jgi:hypothetical protein
MTVHGTCHPDGSAPIGSIRTGICGLPVSGRASPPQQPPFKAERCDLRVVVVLPTHIPIVTWHKSEDARELGDPR